METILADPRCLLIRGDSLDVLKNLNDDSIDAVVTDPPGGISFMNKGWDGDKGGRDGWVAWLAGILRECYRVLKPGAHGLAWAIPRTSHWTAWAVEIAGFEVRDVVAHLYGQGFPKSLDLSKAVDAHLGAEREIVGRHGIPGAQMQEMSAGGKSGKWTGIKLGGPVTAAAATWNGWGTALKPACEHWILFRKPLAGTYAQNLLAHGVGGLNVDGCRIGTGSTGRWPANLALTHDERCVPVGEEVEERPVYENTPEIDPGREGTGWGMKAQRTTTTTTTTTTTYACVEECPVRHLDKDRAGASRFFYVAKPSRAEKDRGLDHLVPRTGGEATDREDGSAGLNSPRAGAGRTGGARNHHPTVKGVDLMRWLVRLVTPPGGVVLDPFTGSGTTGVAALAEGCSFIGSERDVDDATGGSLGYAAVAEGRLRWALAEYPAPAGRTEGKCSSG